MILSLLSSDKQQPAPSALHHQLRLIRRRLIAVEDGHRGGKGNIHHFSIIDECPLFLFEGGANFFNIFMTPLGKTELYFQAFKSTAVFGTMFSKI
jgi:hypothetical protein